MEDINVNELCNEAGKMRKFFKAFSQIDEVLIAVQNSDAVLKQLDKQVKEKEKELANLKTAIQAAEGKIQDSKGLLATAVNEYNDEKLKLDSQIREIKQKAADDVNKTKDGTDKEIMEIRASVRSERRAGEELIKALKVKQAEAQKTHEAVMEALMVEESNLQEKIQHSRSVLEALKAKLSM